jgi:hypothetical protein
MPWLADFIERDQVVLLRPRHRAPHPIVLFRFHPLVYQCCRAGESHPLPLPARSQTQPGGKMTLKRALGWSNDDPDLSGRERNWRNDRQESAGRRVGLG